MQYKFFKIPFSSIEQSEEELNKFLRSHRVLTTECHFCAENGGYWTVSVEYVDQAPIAEAPPTHRRENTDVTIGMKDDEKLRFDHFREIRRQLATKNGVPAYLRSVGFSRSVGFAIRLPEYKHLQCAN